MILTSKNAKDVTRPRKVIFGEEWFVSPELFDHEFFGVVIDGTRAQPFPSKQAAEVFAFSEIDRRNESKTKASIQVIDQNMRVLMDLTTKF